MSDHTPVAPPEPVPPPADAPDPHPAEEAPEHFMGEVTRDPWDDPHQADWPNETAGN